VAAFGGHVQLADLGGIQNITGVAGTVMGIDTSVDEGIGTAAAGVVLSEGQFIAPGVDGQYCIDLFDASVYLLAGRSTDTPSRYRSLPAFLMEATGACFTVAAPSCDSIDFNADGLFPDTLDIADFLSVYAGGLCDGQSSPPPCNTDIDFNNDTLFPDTCDIDSLLAAFSGSGCTPCG
jgi:hypothetical protein